MPSLGEYPDELSLSHQNWRLGGGDRRGAAGRMSAAQGWRAQRLSHPCRPGLSRVITPILASLGVFLVRKTHCHRRCSRVHRPRHPTVTGGPGLRARARNLPGPGRPGAEAADGGHRPDTLTGRSKLDRPGCLVESLSPWRNDEEPCPYPEAPQ